MSEKRIAVRYAKSLVNLAEEKGFLDEIQADMLLVHNVCKENRQLRVMLKNPVILSHNKRAILDKIFKGKVGELTTKFFKVISRKNRIDVLPAIAGEVISLYNTLKDLQVATVATSIPLTVEMRSKIIKIVEETSGKKALLQETVNEDLIGGFVLRIGDQQIDNSISGKLNKLKIQLVDA
ncbi:MAG: ATP synthase F1 subunit delta [Bacteroidota bacterium]